MKTALITTTINVPKVLELYRKFAPSTDPSECMPVDPRGLLGGWFMPFVTEYI